MVVVLVAQAYAEADLEPEDMEKLIQKQTLSQKKRVGKFTMEEEQMQVQFSSQKKHTSRVITKSSARCTVSRHSRSRGLLGELRNGQM